MANTSKQSIAPIIAGIGMATIFGFSFMFTREALTYIEPVHFLSFRFLLAALFLNALRGLGLIKISFPKKHRSQLLLLGLFQPILYFICETYGIQMTSASEGGMMVALIPIFTVTMAAIFLKERPPLPQVLSIVISVMGVLLIGFMQATRGIGENLVGLLILLGAPMAGAAFTILSRHLSQLFSPIEMTYTMMNVGAIFFTVLALLQNIYHQQMDAFFLPLAEPMVWQAILYLALFSSVLAFFLINYTLSHLSASQVSAFPSLTTFIAVAAGALILQEELGWFHYLGGLCIAGGVWGTNYFSRRPAPSATP